MEWLFVSHSTACLDYAQEQCNLQSKLHFNFRCKFNRRVFFFLMNMCLNVYSYVYMFRVERWNKRVTNQERMSKM